jgi:Ca2+-binding EF-hand superfamily protein
VTKEAKFSANVTAVVYEAGASAQTVGAVRQVTFKDGTVQRVRLLELSEQNRSLSWEIIESNPPISYMAATHRITLKKVTDNNTTFVQAFTDFSKDAGAGVLADSKFKKLELFRSLAASTESKFSQFVNSLNLETVRRLSAEQVAQAWAAADANKDGVLDSSEVAEMVGSVVVKLADEKQVIGNFLVNLFNTPVPLAVADEKKGAGAVLEVKEKVVADAAATSKNVLAKLSKGIKSATHEFMSRVDKNKDNKIDKKEFETYFPKWFARKVEEAIKEALL